MSEPTSSGRFYSGRTCSVCGRPIQDRNNLGICHSTTECQRARSEINRRARGVKPMGTRKGTCSVDGCPKPHFANGYCAMHNARVQKTGEPGPAGMIRKRAQIASGGQFGSWTALEDYSGDLVLCRCVCGSERLMSPQVLEKMAGEAECRCKSRLGRPPGRDPQERLTRGSYISEGQLFGLLTTLEAARWSSDRVRCRCKCGNETTPLAHNLRHGHTESCGCKALSSQWKHGLCKHPLYSLWYGIVRRCNNPDTPEYRHYGGRGIQLCERWTGLPDGLLNFAADMGPRPTMQHTVDRENNDGNYDPGNCAWKTIAEQNRNRRKVGALTEQRNEAWARVQELEQELAAARGTLF